MNTYVIVVGALVIVLGVKSVIEVLNRRWW